MAGALLFLIVKFYAACLLVAVVVAAIQYALSLDELLIVNEGLWVINCLSRDDCANSTELGEKGACAGLCERVCLCVRVYG